MIMLNKLSVMRRLSLSVLFITILSSAGLKADSVTVYFPNEPEKKHLVESIIFGSSNLYLS